MSGRKLLDAATDLARAAKSGNAPPELLDDLPGLAHTKRVVDDAQGVGLHVAARDPAERARRAGEAARFAERAEAGVKAAADGSATTASILAIASKQMRRWDLDEMWENFSPWDRVRLIGEMIRRAEEGKKVIHHFVAGAVREIVAKHLDEVQRLVMGEKLRIRDLARREPHAAFLDTGAMGDVHLPTKVIDEGGRSIELGTDRILGIARGRPEQVEMRWPSGDVDKVWVQGELEVTVAIEVKGRTVVAGGVRQQEALAVQGRGTRGYAVIDGKLWLLKYEPAQVKHVVVAPKSHPDFDKAAGMSSLSGGGRLDVIEIPLELDNEIMGKSRRLMAALYDDPVIKQAAARKAASAAQDKPAPKKPRRRR